MKFEDLNEMREYISNEFTYDDLLNALNYFVDSTDFNFFSIDFSKYNYNELLDKLFSLTNFYNSEIIMFLLEHFED
jgi:hypothetical protein